MLVIKHSRDHVINKSLYQLTDQIQLSETICKRQLKFTGNFERLSFFLNVYLKNQVTVSAYQQTNPPIALSSINPRSSFIFDQARQRRHLNRISSHILPSGKKAFEVNEKRKMKVRWKINVENILSCLKRKAS